MKLVALFEIFVPHSGQSTKLILVSPFSLPINDNLMVACISLYEGISQSTDNTIATLENIVYVTKRIKFADLPVLQYLSNENLLKDKKGISGYSLCPDDEAVIAFEPETLL